MTTKLAGMRMTGILALTMDSAAGYSAAQGDPVHVSADWTVARADGTKLCLGHVSVTNVKRVGPTYPVANPGGQVTVEARGWEVRPCVAGGAIAAGQGVVIGAGGIYVAVGTAGAGAEVVGIALNGVANGQKFDLLVK